MESQTIALVSVVLLFVALPIVFIFSRNIERKRGMSAMQMAVEQCKSSFATESATLSERVRAYDFERSQINKERLELIESLEIARKEHLQSNERAVRVPQLELHVDILTKQQNKDRDEILRLSTSEAEKSQSIQDVSLRLVEAEKDVGSKERALAEEHQNVIRLLEESGRLNAELKASRESSNLIEEKFQEEKSLRIKAELHLSAIGEELAESNKKKAIFETEAARISTLERKILDTETTLTEVNKQAADLREATGRVNAELKAERDLLSAARQDLSKEKIQREQSEARANNLSNEVAELNSRIESEQRQSEEKLNLLLQAKEALSNQFKSLANDILEEKTKRFTEQNQTNIGQLLDPLKIKLQEFQGKVEEVYVNEGKDRSALAEQVRQLIGLNQLLSQEAKNLTSALKGSSKTQGNWGEIILERVLEVSGLRKGHEYDVQESHTREDGSRAQLDVVVHLPEDRHLVIDAKVSLLAYEACVLAENDEDRQIAIKRHLDSVRAHMKGLSNKNYQALYGLKSLDFVLMFVPIEPAFMVAITHDKDLYMEALNKNVLLVSPSTLLFVVRTVAHLWRQESQSKNAQEIAKRGSELYDRLAGFVADLEKVGERLRQTQDSYTEARNKLCVNRGNVIRQAEMLKQLGIKPTKIFSDTVLDAASLGDQSVSQDPPSLEFKSE